jgi:alpha-mannosidase
MNSTEQQLRNQLGISVTASKVLIIEQSAHCDWDWVATFMGYYLPPGGGGHQDVETTLSEAITYIQNYQGKLPAYFYTYCEMAYLRQFLKDHADQITVLQQLGKLKLFNIASGGITSADNLLSHGEAFIRNYLIGRQWVSNTLNFAPSDQMWIPDDFGHDAQLPIVLQAMGFMGAGFWRIPAGIGYPNVPLFCQVAEGAPNLVLTNDAGLDFTWQAADGSSIQAHWLSNSYCEGNSSGFVTDSNNDITWNNKAQDAINTFIQQNTSIGGVTLPQPTPYLYVPVDCDFATPYANLPDIIAQWNACNSTGEPGDCPGGANPPYTEGVVAVMGTFDDFMKLVQAYTASDSGNSPLYTYYSNPAVDSGLPAFTPNPYYSGDYGSRPALKRMHYQATRTLLLAESMEIFLEYLAAGNNAANWSGQAAAARANLAAAWNALMPSTHHDYITGTAPDPIYQTEQLEYLQGALSAARYAQGCILNAIAGAVTGGTAVVFNPLGFSRSGVVHMTAPIPGEKFSSATTDHETYTPVDTLPSGAIRFYVADTPSLGYQSVYLSGARPNSTPTLSLQGTAGGPYTLANEFLSATISVAGITELYDLQNDPQSTTNLMNGVGNQIVFYNDGGGIYRFGNEVPCEAYAFFADSSISIQNTAISVIEDGDLMKCVSVSGAVELDEGALPFTMQYSLLPGESFLRMETTGTAPSGYSVMVRFPFTAQVGSLTYGTAYHWDTRAPRNFFEWHPSPAETELMTFEPTHEFVIPVDGEGNYLGAIYHASTPGWAIDTQGNLLGCILRNTPGKANPAAVGTDSGAHTSVYALRVPGTGENQLQSPTAGCQPGGPLGEAYQFNNPMVGVAVPDPPTKELPTSVSLLSTADSPAVITAAKAGTMNEADLIVRVYQPTNSSLANVAVSLDPLLASLYQSDAVLQVSQQTALETSMTGSGANIDLQPEANSFSFTAPLAITTFALNRQ